LASTDQVLKGEMASPEKGGMRRKDKISIAIIFRYADGVDIMLMLLGTAGAIGDGMSTNCLLVFASRLMNNLGYGKTQQNRGNFMDEVEKVSNCQLSLSLSLSLSHISSFWVLLTVQFVLRILGISSNGGCFYG
jgi:ATP-binding cassette subfamily B (MDR/TAP) protein 1